MKKLCLTLFVAAVACGESGPQIDVVITPAEGTAPLMVTFDATKSRDDTNPAAELRARFDFDGDGTFDTDASTELTSAFVYEVEGSFAPRVEISSTPDRTGVEEFVVTVGPNTPPTANITTSGTSGRSPVEVQIDASASSDPDEDDGALQVRFDFDGNGTFDTDFSTEKVLTHVYQQAGRFAVTVEVRDRAGATHQATSLPSLEVSAGADLDVDSNRDGNIDDSDDANEDTWSVDHGAVFVSNVDDDDFDLVRDGLNAAFEGGADTADFAQIILRQNTTLNESDSVTIVVAPAAAAASVRVVAQIGAGLDVVHRPGDAGRHAIDRGTVMVGDLTLLMEAIHGRNAEWNGDVTLTVEMSVAGEMLVDSVALRVAPVIFTDNLRPAERLFVMRISDRRFSQNLPFFDALDRDIPNGVELYSADEYEYVGDRWLQDPFQTGYQSMPSSSGQLVMKTHLQTQRPTGRQGLEPFLTQALLGPDLGYEYPGRSRDTSLNYGGNLEVVPPHDGYPLGRLIAGGGDGGTLNGVPWSDSMSAIQIAWLNAQRIQGPVVEASTEWLAVGHVDEIFMFIPNPTAGEGERPWIVVLASPTLARTQLEQVSAQGGGGLVVFNGRETQTTVDTILGDQPLMDYQDVAQARIDSVREVLETNFGLTDADFVEVPVLFEWHFIEGLDLSAAYSPGIQNLVVTNEHVFVPDPEGPRFEGTDVWRASAERTLTALGLTVHFVDVFDSYHLALGEAHCGTEVEGTPYEAAWWLHDRRP